MFLHKRVISILRASFQNTAPPNKRGCWVAREQYQPDSRSKQGFRDRSLIQLSRLQALSRSGILKRCST